MKRYVVLFITLILLVGVANAAVDDAFTKSLLHFNGGWTDESGKTWTAVNTPTISPTTYKFGTGSANFVRVSSQYIYAPSGSDFNYSSGDWTVDYWMYISAAPTTTQIPATASYNNSYGAWTLYFDSDTTLVAMGSHDGTSNTWSLSFGAIPLNTWTHVALVRSNGTISGYKGGTLGGTFVNSSVSTLSTKGQNPALGGRASTAEYYSGRIDEARLSKGVARWTGNFTPPTREYQTSWTYSTAGTFYWVCPDDIDHITLNMLGGGGSGRSAWYFGAGGYAAGLGGSVGEARNVSSIPVTAGTNYTVVVGLGGETAVGAPYSTGETHPGASSSAFGYSADGGAGGLPGGMYNSDGGDGDTGWGTTPLAVNGTDSPTRTGGIAGLGNGAGGGGAASATADGSYHGGKGADGQLIITQYGYGSGNLPDFVADTTTGYPGTLVHFTDLSSIVDGSGLVYNWSWGDGTYSSAFGDALHVFSYTGSYDVALTLSTTTGEQTETKLSYINIVTAPDNLWFTPSQVRFSLVDFNMRPLDSIQMSATPLNFTAPDDWAQLLLGIQPDVNITDTMVSGITGTDGSISFPMLQSVEYNLSIFGTTKNGRIVSPFAFTMYPASSDYLFTIPTDQLTGILPETPAENAISFTMTNQSINSSHQWLNVSYTDPTAGTDNATFFVTNASDGNISYTTFTAGAGANTASFSYLLTNPNGGSIQYGLVVNQTVLGEVSQSNVVAFGNFWALTDLGSWTWIEQWIAFGLIVILGAMFSRSSVPVGMIVLVGLTAFFSPLGIGWLQPVYGVAALSAGLAGMGFIAVLTYILNREGKS